MVADSSTVLVFEITNDASDMADPTEGSNGYKESPNVGGTVYQLSAVGDGISELDTTSYVQYVDGLYGGSTTTSMDVAGAPTVSVGAPQYATGYIGGRLNVNNTYADEEAATGLHTGGANYLMGDGHVKWFMAQQVSSGQNAVASDCYQSGDGADGNNATVTDCTGYANNQAAGTSDSHFGATFSAT
jgi:prepilin-type processing-associated H-X9-DG protein